MQDALEDKSELLILLSLCANGNSNCDIHQQLPLLQDKAETEEWKTQLQRELDWVNRTRAAVIAGQPLYEALLTYSEANIRETAGFLLASLARPAPQTAAAL